MNIELLKWLLVIFVMCIIFHILSVIIGNCANNMHIVEGLTPVHIKNMWKEEYEMTKELFDRRYKPTNLEFMPQYPIQDSIMGDFQSDGPLAFNY